MKEKRKTNNKKTVKKTAEVSKPKVNGKCGVCIFYVPNKDKKGIGSCFEMGKMVKEAQSPECKGKFFKHKVQPAN